MKPKVSDEIKAKLLARVYTDLMPKPKPPPKPKLEAELRSGAGEVLSFPPKLSEQELYRRQALIDQAWERTLDAKRELEAEAARSCHRGPKDPDWEIAAFDPIWGKRK
jgi:hypothetical protein